MGPLCPFPRSGIGNKRITFAFGLCGPGRSAAHAGEVAGRAVRPVLPAQTSPLYLPNMGGSGLALPQNSLTWAIMATVVATVWLTLPAGQSVRLTVTARWILLAIVILAIPLYHTAPQWREAGWVRWLALLGGWVFYFSLLQYPLARFGRHALYYAILTATVFQAGIALLQLTVPAWLPAWLAYPMRSGRVYGVFQQSNVLASFMATGLALALMLFLLPTFVCRHRRRERLRITGLGGILTLLSLLLVWVQSRIGWVGGGAVALVLVWRFYPVAPRRTRWAAGLMIVGLVIGTITLFYGGVLDGTLRTDGYASSNHARYTMLHDTLAMIGLKPLAGWGYGGFEYGFQHFRLTQGLSSQGVGIVRHPHNELLLWWAEGGVVALIGMGLLLACGLRLATMAMRGPRTNRRCGTRPTDEAVGLCIGMLPIVLHTQTEYPFVLSAAHWAILLLLLALLDRQTSPSYTPGLPATITTVLRVALPTLAIPLAVMAGIGLYGNLMLTAIERSQFVTLEPARRVMALDLWINTERWQYDRQTHALLTFNHTRDLRLLDSYVRWARTYLSRRVDKNVYAAWIAIAQYRQDLLTYRRLQQEAHTLFPEHTRFIPQDIHPQQEVVR